MYINDYRNIVARLEVVNLEQIEINEDHIENLKPANFNTLCFR